MAFDLPSVPTVTKFMFCMTLRVGALVIGYVSLFSALGGMISSSFFIYMVNLYVKQKKDEPPPGHTTEDIISNAVGLYIVHGLKQLIFSFYFVISLLLVIGVHKSRPRFMRYYYVAGMINLVLNLAVVTVGFVFMGFFSTVTQLLSCAIVFYFLLVVRSAYLEMEENMKPRTDEMQMYSPQKAPPVLQ